MGETWSVIATPTSKPLLDVYFVNDNIGFAVGGDGVSSLILKTSDGGTNWTTQVTEPTTNSSHNTAFFTDENIGYIGNVEIYKTVNAGDVWDVMTSPKQIKDIFFPTYSTGYAVGYDGAILKLTCQGMDLLYRPKKSLHYLSKN